MPLGFSVDVLYGLACLYIRQIGLSTLVGCDKHVYVQLYTPSKKAVLRKLLCGLFRDSIVRTVLSGLYREVVSLGRSTVIAL